MDDAPQDTATKANPFTVVPIEITISGIEKGGKDLGTRTFVDCPVPATRHTKPNLYLCPICISVNRSPGKPFVCFRQLTKKK